MSEPAESHIRASGVTLPAIESLVGTTIDGRYVVESLLGEGGMGLVYRARHSVLNKLLAVKVLRSEVSNNPQVIARFLQEARSATAIGNQHIIDVSDFGTLPDGSTYFAMEYLDGLPLTRVIEQDAPLPIARVIHVGRQLCAALQAAHGAGIVHRDLKPDNIFLVKRGKEHDFVKVLDFGIARVGGSSSKITQAGQVFGTPHYMPPEQCQGEPVDHRADIYALGIILFELITGRLPFESSSVIGLLAAHLTEPAPPPSAFRDTCPATLDAVILRCLEKRPDHRYSSCAELSADLAAVASGGDLLTAPRISGIVQSVRPSAPTSVAPPSASSIPAPAFDDGSSSRTVLMLGLAFGLLGLGALSFGAYAVLGRQQAQASAIAPPPVIPVFAAPAAGVPSTAPAAQRSIRMLTEPAGAEVHADGQLLGTTPLDVPRPASGARRDLRLRLVGYEEKVVTISSGTLADQLHFDLQPVSRAHGSSHGSSAGASAHPAAPRPTSESPASTESTHAESRPRRHTSDVINPWAN